MNRANYLKTMTSVPRTHLTVSLTNSVGLCFLSKGKPLHGFKWMGPGPVSMTSTCFCVRSYDLSAFHSLPRVPLSTFLCFKTCQWTAAVQRLKVQQRVHRKSIVDLVSTQWTVQTRADNDGVKNFTARHLLWAVMLKTQTPIVISENIRQEL